MTDKQEKEAIDLLKATQQPGIREEDIDKIFYQIGCFLSTLNDTQESGGYIDIVFDGPPGPVSGHFVEVENDSGASISIGEWVDRDDGLCALRIPRSRISTPKESGGELHNLADALVENVIATSDDDILKEVEEDHGDPQYLANKMRGIIDKASLSTPKESGGDKVDKALESLRENRRKREASTDDTSDEVQWFINHKFYMPTDRDIEIRKLTFEESADIIKAYKQGAAHDSKLIHEQAREIRRLNDYLISIKGIDPRNPIGVAKRRAAEALNPTEQSDTEDRRPPCSPTCYHHVTHPCEKCGRLQGLIPKEQEVNHEQSSKSVTTSEPLATALPEEKCPNCGSRKRDYRYPLERVGKYCAHPWHDLHKEQEVNNE